MLPYAMPAIIITPFTSAAMTLRHCRPLLPPAMLLTDFADMPLRRISSRYYRPRLFTAAYAITPSSPTR